MSHLKLQFPLFFCALLVNIALSAPYKQAGCPDMNSPPTADGVLGLGGGRYSLINQLAATEFSYCLGNISDPHDQHSKLIIGEGTNLISTQMTPLTIDGHYYINLEGITIGGASLPIDGRLFRRRDGQGGVMIDTRSAYTYLEPVAAHYFHEAVRNEIAAMDGSLEPSIHIHYGRTNHSMLCYNGFFRRDLVGFPEVELRFEGGAVMDLTTEHIFQQMSGRFCLTVIPSDQALTDNADWNILGIMIQQFHYIKFDLQGKTMGFKKMDCQQV